MKENQIVTLENNKKYFIHDKVTYMNNNYLYLISVDDSFDDFTNEFIIRKELFENCEFYLTELNTYEMNFFKNELGI